MIWKYTVTFLLAVLGALFGLFLGYLLTIGALHFIWDVLTYE